TSAVDSILRELQVDESITIGATEAQMDENRYLIYLNRSTPLGMASLFNRFDKELRHQSESFQEIAMLLDQCKTGTDRLPAPLENKAVIGHKTGTGFISPEGRLTALNDCGCVKLPDGSRYAIAIFIADSAYNIEESSAIIATISEMVYKMITAR
ncbi:MAG: class A beta-lactamase-related serine hydrolase, partial [Muribaculaceae bacterium]|nr:class A beta-lactamase-related serine hydrolase [Muribaculaceae bacterium]